VTVAWSPAMIHLRKEKMSSDRVGISRLISDAWRLLNGSGWLSTVNDRMSRESTLSWAGNSMHRLQSRYEGSCEEETRNGLPG
jgi:hypothetical protein